MKLLREPLFQFVLLGAALFAVYAVAAGLLRSASSHRVEITAADIELLARTWELRWQRLPTEEELRGLVEGRVREEILYREALAVGLDENDTVVRRRMVQKMMMLTQDIALLADPTDTELRAFYEEHREEYRVPPLLTFSHVYFNMDERGRAGEEYARRVLAGIRAEKPPPRRAPERGDRFMPGHDFELVTPQDVSREFGDRFAQALFELGPGWHGPIVSGFGLHLVNVIEVVEGRIPDYAEIREELVIEYNVMRRERAREALYEGLSEKYDIEIDEEALLRSVLERP